MTLLKDMSMLVFRQRQRHMDVYLFVRCPCRCSSGLLAPRIRATACDGNGSNEHFEKLWRNLFSDPSQWWDNRSGKPNPRFPDFKHKATGDGLWLIDGRNPPWVASEIVSIAPGVSIFSHTQSLSKYNKANQYQKTLEHFERMQQEGLHLDAHVFVHVIKACTALQDLEYGRRIHRQILETGIEMDLHVSSCLVNMYSKCGSIVDAWKVFNNMGTRDVATLNAMILGCVKCGENLKALELFQQMQKDGIEPDSRTIVGVFNACASRNALEEGRRYHEQIIRRGFKANVYVISSLVDMYVKCGSIEEAWRLFKRVPTRNVVVWTAMIVGFVKCGEGLKALDLFHQMRTVGVEPDAFTFVGVLNACSVVPALKEGRHCHEQIIRRGFESDVYVVSSLIDMYSKCGNTEEAWKVFNKMPTHNVVAWNAMILGFVKCGEGLRALKLFQQMKKSGVEPNSVTFVGLLNACAGIAALEEGRRLHRKIIQKGLDSDVYVGNSLVDMYAKCGSLDKAWREFKKMPALNAVSWTTMIMGFAMHGQAKEAVSLFECMFQAGSEINEVTFICLLSACSHGGLVKEGIRYFQSMWSMYGVSPIQEHYTCMVDILGRAGHLEDAETLVKTMPFEPCAAPWMSLLSACRIYGNVEMGERASRQVLELDRTRSSGYVLLSNIYAAAGNYSKKALVHEKRSESGALKQLGRTWIEVNNKIHSFILRDCQHPQLSQIYEELARLSDKFRLAGYVPDVRFAIDDGDEDNKVEHMCLHSEKLAVAFGLISTPAGTALRIVKNLRVCGQCHTAIKFISKIEGRPITVRDANLFHHFKDGLCSCGDY